MVNICFEPFLEVFNKLLWVVVNRPILKGNSGQKQIFYYRYVRS